MNQEKVGKLIKDIRKEYNLTQDQLAKKLGVTFQAVSKWENGKNIPDISVLKQISDEFNVDLNSILDGNLIAKKRSNKLYIALIVIFVIILSIILIFLSNKKDYDFKTISSDCNNFKIFGSVAYNSKKSTIYISKIEYCGGEDDTKYERIESTLYESIDNVDRKIENYINKEKNFNKTLEEYLQGLTFYVDNYSASCKDFTHSNLFLLINATTSADKTTSYKIPLNLDNSCKINTNSTNS